MQSGRAVQPRPAVRESKSRSKRFWFDPRFGIGVVLIVGAVAGTAFVVGAADTSITVYAARESLSPGTVVTAADLVPTSVRVGDAESLYLVPGDVPDDGIVITRAVDHGEIVPASATGSLDGLSVTTVVVPVTDQLAASVRANATVDIWAAKELENGVFGPPVVIVPSASVVRLVESSGLVVDDSSAGVEVLVPKTAIARVLEAIANSDALSIVPVTLGVKG